MRNRTDDQVTLVMIRHGKTKANEERRYLGRTDEALSEKGIEDLLVYKKRGIYPKIDCLFCSPMKRCLQTAGFLYPELPPIVIPEWEETDFGRFEYKNYEMLKDDTAYQAWIDSGGTLPFPEGESREEFLSRCENGFYKMCEKLRLRSFTNASSKLMKGAATVGMIAHGGTIMALLSLHGGKNFFDCQVQNGDGYLCRVNGLENDARIVEIKKLREET